MKHDRLLSESWFSWWFHDWFSWWPSSLPWNILKLAVEMKLVDHVEIDAGIFIGRGRLPKGTPSNNSWVFDVRFDWPSLFWPHNSWKGSMITSCPTSANSYYRGWKLQISENHSLHGGNSIIHIESHGVTRIFIPSLTTGACIWILEPKKRKWIITISSQKLGVTSESLLGSLAPGFPAFKAQETFGKVNPQTLGNNPDQSGGILKASDLVRGFNPSENMKVSWDDYSWHMDK